ncbi:MAG TPA: hypothetical protein VGN07_04160 [Steroidobacteraceae bacterium]|jgi:hypothetical protein
MTLQAKSKTARLGGILSLVACLVVAMAGIAPVVVAADNGVSKVNGSVHVAAGEQTGDVETVNGSIQIDAGASVGNVETVNGSVRVGDRATAKALNTVNGGISLGADSKADSLETVNGKLQVAESAQIAGNVTATNGTLSLARGASVGGEVSNVNGAMTLEGAHIGRGLHTSTGDITLRAGSRIDGGILVKKTTPSLFNWHHRNPRIVIGPDVVVTGPLKFEREVDLYVSDRAKVGQIEGATPVMLTTDAEGNSIPKQ